MKHTLIKNIECTDVKTCSNDIITKLETKFNCKLYARDEKDIVNGYVSIEHEQNKHTITIEFYDKNENPNANHLTTFKKLSAIPKESEIKL
jgi:hypothetical protein|tara:strand:+ start:589 stop:861 length:273 start_codon:yes stop_codon:yes gene_type:complete